MVHGELRTAAPIAPPKVVELDLATEETIGPIPTSRHGNWLILHPRQETGLAWIYTTFFEPPPIA